jgi:hypothetical protein
MLMLPSVLLRNKPERTHLSSEPLHRPDARRLGDLAEQAQLRCQK